MLRDSPSGDSLDFVNFINCEQTFKSVVMVPFLPPSSALPSSLSFPLSPPGPSRAGEVAVLESPLEPPGVTLDINVNILWRRSVESQTGGWLAGWLAAGRAPHCGADVLGRQALFNFKLIFIS